MLSITITQQGTNGTAVVVDDNTATPHVEYTANSTQGPVQDQIKFQATDGTDPKSAVITVNTQNLPAPPANQPPECNFFSEGFFVGSTENVGSCVDDQFAPVHIEITAQGTKGVASINNNDTENPSVSYTSSTAGADQFKVIATDEEGLESLEYTVDTCRLLGHGAGGERSPAESLPEGPAPAVVYPNAFSGGSSARDREGEHGPGRFT